MWRLVESGENYVEAWREEENQLVRRVNQGEEVEGKGEENRELLVKFDNIVTTEKQDIPGKTI